MFRKKQCTLCGSKIMNGICSECGLDNTRTRMYQEAECLSEDQRDKMYEKNHTDANKKFFDELRQEEQRSQSSYQQTQQDTSSGRTDSGRPKQGRPPQGRPPQGRPPQGRTTYERPSQQEAKPKKSRTMLKTIFLIYAIIYIVSILLNLMQAI